MFRQAGRNSKENSWQRQTGDSKEVSPARREAEIRYLFSLRTSWARSWVRRAQGKFWPGKSTQRYYCRMPKSLIPFTSTGPWTSQYNDCRLSTCGGADHSDVKRWHRGSGPCSHKSQFCHQSAVRPWINCLTSAHVLIYKWRWQNHYPS